MRVLKSERGQRSAFGREECVCVSALACKWCAFALGLFLPFSLFTRHTLSASVRLLCPSLHFIHFLLSDAFGPRVVQLHVSSLPFCPHTSKSSTIHFSLFLLSHFPTLFLFLDLQFSYLHTLFPYFFGPNFAFRTWTSFLAAAKLPTKSLVLEMRWRKY